MKNQALFSSKDKSRKLKCCLLQFLFGALRVKLVNVSVFYVIVLYCFDKTIEEIDRKSKRPNSQNSGNLRLTLDSLH